MAVSVLASQYEYGRAPVDTALTAFTFQSFPAAAVGDRIMFITQRIGTGAGEAPAGVSLVTSSATGVAVWFVDVTSANRGSTWRFQSGSGLSQANRPDVWGSAHLLRGQAVTAPAASVVGSAVQYQSQNLAYWTPRVSSHPGISTRNRNSLVLWQKNGGVQSLPDTVGSWTDLGGLSYQRSAWITVPSQGTNVPAAELSSVDDAAYIVLVEQPAANIAPNSPPLLTPAQNETLNRDAPNRFSWAHNDPDGDSQGGYSWRYRLVGATTWTSVSAQTPSQFHDAAAGTFTAGSYEWQVQTTDDRGAVGTWSSSGFFAAATAPAGPPITAPISGATVGAARTTVEWSATSQQAYRVRVVEDNNGAPDVTVIAYDTGEVSDSATRAVTVPFPTNSVYRHVQVQVRSSGLLSPWSSVRVLVSYTRPATPRVSVEAHADSVLVVTRQPLPVDGQPSVSHVNVWVTADDAGDAYRKANVPVRIATNLPAGTSFTDRSVAHGVNYRYAVEAIGVNGTSSASAYISDPVDLGSDIQDDFLDDDFSPVDFR